MQPWSRSNDTVTTEAAIKKLDSLYAPLRINRPTPKLDPDYQNDESTVDRIAVLPDISEYPFIVNPTTDNFITIYSSVEKTDWLIYAANKFNQSGATVDGKPVSVGIRAFKSSLGADFISSGKYTPDVYIPKSKIYGDMLSALGIKTNLTESHLVGNVAGIVITKQKNDDLIKKYGSVDNKSVIESVLKDELALGYSNPLSSEDGFNFLLSVLYEFDSSDPTSDGSVEQLRKFQDKISFVAYEDTQLITALASGTLDAIVIDYQTYANSPNLKSSYEFMPIGMRQDTPVYEIGDLTALKKQIVSQFVNFCKNADSQKAATDRGFNNFDNYSSTITLNGSDILQAQEISNKEKYGSSGLTVVFVADTSGSMEGSPLLNLRAGLNRLIGVIGSNVNVGLVTFSDTVSIDVQIAKFDSIQKSYFSYAVRSISAGGGTAMFDAIVVAQKMLMDTKANNPNTKLMLFVLTDGESNTGYKFKDIEKLARGTKIPMNTIGYNANIDALQKLSELNEAITMNADSENIISRLESLFKAYS
jgi:Ca-activated chloride channel family protein